MLSYRPHFLLLTLGLFAFGLRAAVAGESAEAALRAQVESLRQELARQEVRVNELTRRNQVLEATQASSGKALALANESVTTQEGPRVAPSSTLGWDRAVKAASAARYMVSGSSLMTVMPTGSMKPMFDERAILIMEPAPFADLKVGDIVTYTHPRHQMPVVHRITEKRGEVCYTKGDNNDLADEIAITQSNYQARVFGIIYAKESAQN